MTTTSAERYWCEYALVEARVENAVAIDVVNGRFASIESGADLTDDAERLAGFTIPGMANSHSHAFQRALRSRTQSDTGTFWTWRELMYRAAQRLDPDRYFRLARATFAEMSLAGIACVGEFHYVHHQNDGTSYDNPNEMGDALSAAATEAGIRMTMLDTLYLHGGLTPQGYREPSAAQLRFSDGSADDWVQRVSDISAGPHKVGTAIHSARAVDPAAMSVLSAWANEQQFPIHAHVSEQPAENDACIAYFGKTPIQLLSDAGALSDRFTAVHATHLSSDDIDMITNAGAGVAMCPTTERDLGDGIGPTKEFATAGIAMALGSDSHAVIDLFEEARGLELNERLRSTRRGIHSAFDLLKIATNNGHRCLGWGDAGSITVGNRADLVTIGLDSVRTAGTPNEAAIEATVFAANAGDVSDVIVDGRRIVAARNHVAIDVAHELDASIKELMDYE